MDTSNIILAFLAAALIVIVGVYAFEEIEQTGMRTKFVGFCENTIVKAGTRLGIRSYSYVGRH